MVASDWQRALVALTVTVVGAVIIALLFWARSIFILVTLAIFLSFVLSPVVNRVQRRGLGRTTAVIATVGLVGVGSFAIGTVLAHQISQLTPTLTARKDTIVQKLTSAKQWVVGDGESQFGKLVEEVGNIFDPKSKGASAESGGAGAEAKGTKADPLFVEQAAPSMASQWSGVLTPAAELLGQAAFTFILTVFMLLKREDLRNRMIRLLGSGKVTTTTKAADDASQRISKYLLSQLMRRARSSFSSCGYTTRRKFSCSARS